MEFHDKTVKEVLDKVATTEKGLSEEEAKRRLLEYGPNKIKEGKRAGPLVIFLRQFHDVLIYILIFAVLVSFIIGEKIDAYVILGILLFNAVFGFVQEYRAERAISFLKQMTILSTNVLRDGVEKVIAASELVPGDVVILEPGDKIPADMRIIEENNLQTNEASLTGESMPCSKDNKPVNRNTPLAERGSMVYSSTDVVRGTGKAVVIKTGMVTEIGKIADMIQKAEDHRTPLQIKLREFGKFLGYLVVAICLIVFIIGMIRGFDLMTMFLTAVALAVAAVPEGLPAIVTVCLALGVQRMVKKNALIRKLSSIETLGCVTVIASDKTGTLTKNEMTATKIYANHEFYNITGHGYQDDGEFFHDKEKVDASKEFSKLLEIAMTCNNATENIGDPTERALFYAAKKGGAERLKRIKEIPFDSDTKFMATIHKGFEYYKGAPEVILKMCKYIEIGGKRRRILDKDMLKILEANHEMADDALRVLAMSYKENEQMCFVGLIGMIDPPKDGVKDAMIICKGAGIRPLMITGDHPRTAAAIAKKIGFTGRVITGRELDSIGAGELKEEVKKYSIYARTTSGHKVRILKALQDNGEIVAMTGDGVNDAPAIKNSDVGVAMSLRGTDVTRDSSDMVLTDDHFSSIVSAIEEGRVIYDNIKKFIGYLLLANTAEVGVVLVAMLAGLPLPLLPLQILWINLMTDSWPAIALGVNPAAKDIMNRKPRSQKENILSGLKSFMLVAGIIGTLLTLGVFTWAMNSGFADDKSRTLALTALIFFELFIVFAVKSKKPFEKMFNNMWLNLAVIFSILLQVVMVSTPVNKLFRVTALTLNEWIIVIVLAFIGYLMIELFKFIMSKREKVVVEVE